MPAKLFSDMIIITSDLLASKLDENWPNSFAAKWIEGPILYRYP